jgi:thiol-disulfide isomerase/thioredoxin
MGISAKSLFIGFVAGAALTLLVLDLWGRHYANEHFGSAQPRLLQPYLQQRLDDIAKMNIQGSGSLPEPPWLPGLSSTPHDGWQLKSLSGKAVTLGDFKGKVVFLDIWATHCGPCVAELPNIKRLADSLKNENVAFLLPTRDEEAHVRAFLHKNPIDLPMYLASESAPDMPGTAIPATYILDRQGVIVFREIGGVNWDTDNVRAFLRNLENQ